jgi:hypothetical protein
MTKPKYTERWTTTEWLLNSASAREYYADPLYFARRQGLRRRRGPLTPQERAIEAERRDDPCVRDQRAHLKKVKYRKDKEARDLAMRQAYAAAGTQQCDHGRCLNGAVKGEKRCYMHRPK